MENQNPKFNDFIKKILELQKEKEKANEKLPEEALWEIAQAMGLEETDLQTAKQNYLARGHNHLSHKNWHNAIQEFEQLLIISPDHTEATFGLANAYTGLWKQNQKQSDKAKAIQYAEKTVQTNPDFKDAYALIYRLNKKPSTKKPPQNTSGHIIPEKSIPSPTKPQKSYYISNIYSCISCATTYSFDLIHCVLW